MAAVRAVFAAGALIIGFALFGGLVLDYLHVSVHSLSIAGGLLLLLVALEMLRGEDYPTTAGRRVSRSCRSRPRCSPVRGRSRPSSC